MDWINSVALELGRKVTLTRLETNGRTVQEKDLHVASWPQPRPAWPASFGTVAPRDGAHCDRTLAIPRKILESRRYDHAAQGYAHPICP